jgi:membrane protein DedA with SNARE-associated domain
MPDKSFGAARSMSEPVLAALWCAVWVTIGYVAGNRIDVVYPKFEDYEIYIAIAAGRAGRRVHRSRGLQAPQEYPAGS